MECESKERCLCFSFMRYIKNRSKVNRRSINLNPAEQCARVNCDNNICFIFSECSKHCSMCYNETECFECTQGYFLTEEEECQRM